MINEIVLAKQGDPRLDSQTMFGMYRLRHMVFHDRLGWEVNSDEGMERDEFDLDEAVYVLVKGEESHVEGCWRLLPTTGPYMLKDVFPQLLDGKPAPERHDVWELSRFALDTNGREGERFGLSATPVKMVQSAVQFAKQNGIKRYVSVTSVAIERMFRRLGVTVTRLGSPIRIGRVLTVACTLEIDEDTEFALFGTLPEQAERVAA